MAKDIKLSQVEVTSPLLTSTEDKVNLGTLPIKLEKITLGDKDKNGIGKIALSNNVKKKVIKSVNVYQMTKDNKDSEISTTISETHIAILFDNAKLLSFNQILALLQKPKIKGTVFSYKKSWHNIIKDLLTNLHLNGEKLPYFEDAVEVTIFRQAPRLVDEDALTPMFKFIIDALKRTQDNPHGVLAEDNPKIMHKILCYSEKGPNCVGIKIKVLENKKELYDKYKLLNE